jgi:hypothetical protein
LAQRIKAGYRTEKGERVVILDTLHRSEHVVFRPSAAVNQPSHFQTFNKATDWPKVDLDPAFTGKAERIFKEDQAFTK